MSETKDQPLRRVCLGKISGVHGIKGLVKILPYGDDINLLDGDLFTSETGEETLSIQLKNMQGKHVLAALTDINDRTAAESFRDTELWIPRSALPEPNDGEYYIEDLVGMAAIDEKQGKIGTVISVQNFGAGDLLEIRPNDGDTFFVLFTDDSVGEINFEHQTIQLFLAESAS